MVPEEGLPTSNTLSAFESNHCCLRMIDIMFSGIVDVVVLVCEQNCRRERSDPAKRSTSLVSKLQIYNFKQQHLQIQLQDLLSFPIDLHRMRRMATHTIASLPRLPSETLASIILDSSSSNLDAQTPPSKIAVVDVRDHGIDPPLCPSTFKFVSS